MVVVFVIVIYCSAYGLSSDFLGSSLELEDALSWWSLVGNRLAHPTEHRLLQRWIAGLLDEGLVGCVGLPGRNGSRGEERLFFARDRGYRIILSVCWSFSRCL